MRNATEIPNFRHLLAIREAVRQESLAGAARAINLSQPAVTQAVKGIEAQAGSALFERHAGGMVPTGAGRLLAARIERALALIAQAERATGATAPLSRLASAVQLRALIAVVETGGFSAAARRLGVAQPSIHRAVRDLEALCGRPLVARGAHGLEPTREARILARSAGLAFAEIRQGFEEVREQAGIMDGRLWIGSLPLAISYLLPAAVTRLLESYPGAHVRIVDGPYDELLHELRHGALDLTIGALRDPPPGADLRQEKLFDDPLAIMVRAGHPLLAHRHIDAQALAALDWVAPRDGTPARRYFETFFAAHGLTPPARIIECSSLAAVRALLMQSDRAALLSEGQTHLEKQSGELAVLKARMAGTERAIGLTLRQDWRPTAMQATFLTIVRTLAHDLNPAARHTAVRSGGD